MLDDARFIFHCSSSVSYLELRVNGNLCKMKPEQTWLVRGSLPVLWTIPFRVTFEDEHSEAEMFAAVPLLKIQQKAVDWHMERVAHGRQVNGAWMVRRRELKLMAQHVLTECDPEELFSWERKREYRYDPKLVDNRDRNEFLDTIFHLGIGKSREETEYLWKSFCNHALDWLINHEKPVDMYFAVLHPSVYRRNWCERIHAESWVPMKEEWLKVNQKFQQHLRGGRLLAVTDEGTIKRYIEIELTENWTKAIKVVESTRLKRLNPVRYAELIAETIIKQLGISARIYAAYVAAIREPIGSVTASGVVRPKAIPKIVWDTRKRKPRDWTDRSLGDALGFLALVANQIKRVPRPNAGVSRVPVVQPNSKDLRDAGRDLLQSQKQSNGNSGVFVPTDYKERYADKLLVVR